MATQKSMQQFLAWLSANDPFLYEVAMRGGQILQAKTAQAVAGGDYSLGISWGDIGSGLTDAFKVAVGAVKDVIPAYTQYKAQSKVLKLQLKRAEQGQPPLEAEYYTPTVKVAPEITPQTEQAINRVAQQAVQQVTSQAGTGLQKMIIPAALGLGAVLVIMMIQRRRR